ncbi:MAG TPA: hypothetical protein VGU64_09075 [Terriglobales bacterium]|nr:hypothetical protein [Terriglobales bacterium]
MTGDVPLYLKNMPMKAVSNKKRFNYQAYAFLITALALTCAALSGCETSGTADPGATTSVAGPASQNAARLIIRRAANMGTGLFLDIDIDGASVGSIGMGQIYRGSLLPGQHVVSVLLRPNQLNLPRTQKTLTVEKGQTYALTAMWQGNTVVLR